MYKSQESGLIVYETFEELLDADIIFAHEYKDFYYIRVKSEDYYDNTVWKVNKATKEVSFMYYTEYFDIMDDATPIDPDSLR